MDNLGVHHHQIRPHRIHRLAHGNAPFPTAMLNAFLQNLHFSDTSFLQLLLNHLGAGAVYFLSLII